MELAGADELIARFGGVDAFAERQAANRVALGPAYIEYVFTVSAPEHAISLPLASFVLTVCEAVDPVSAADLGSGFSSFVLRRFASERPAGLRVVSVDDDPDWLAKTAAFLASVSVIPSLILLAIVFCVCAATMRSNNCSSFLPGSRAMCLAKERRLPGSSRRPWRETGPPGSAPRES